MARYPVLRGLYDLDRTIGCGGFAKVKLATHILTGEKVAIKIMEKHSLGENLHRVRVELDALQTLSHRHISQLYQVLETETHFFLVVEYCSGGELFDHIVEKNRLSEKESRAAFRQIVSAVAYLHSLGFVHRDLKPENVLLDKDLNMKLIDFGLCAKPCGGLTDYLFTSCGSPTYAAPELVLGKKYLGHEVDVWSMGVLLYALLCGFLPFDDDKIDTLYKKILDGKYEEPAWLTMDSRKLIRSMLQNDPKKRIRVSELLNHPWVLRGYREPVSVNNSCNMKERDSQCVNIMARHKGVTPEEMWEILSKWKYDYNTATYFLMLNRKRRGFPVRLFGPGATPYRNYRSKAPPIPSLDIKKKEIASSEEESLKSNATPIKRPITDDSTPVVPDKRERFALTPVNEECPSLNVNAAQAVGTRQQRHGANEKRRISRRLHSPGVDQSPASPRRATATRREQQQNVVNGKLAAGTVTPGRPAPPPPTTTTAATPDRTDRCEPARGLLGSIERSLNRVRHILTPRRKLDIEGAHSAQSSPRPGAASAATPTVLSAKGLCNVSTASRNDPDEVLRELQNALTSKGITCKQKGFTLRGKVDESKGRQLSFELEVCLIRAGAQDAVDAPPPVVGIRRKRLKGDAWCYKRVCEEVLALAAQGSGK